MMLLIIPYGYRIFQKVHLMTLMTLCIVVGVSVFALSISFIIYIAVGSTSPYFAILVCFFEAPPSMVISYLIRPRRLNQLRAMKKGQGGSRSSRHSHRDRDNLNTPNSGEVQSGSLQEAHNAL